MNKYHIVIADDHPMFLDALAANLQGAIPNLLVETVTNYQGLHGIIARNRNDLDLVIMDLLMPDGDGANGIRYLRAQFPELPLLVVSGQDDFASRNSCLDAGASEFLSKSADRESFRTAVAKMLMGEYEYELVQPIADEATAERSKADDLTLSQKRVLILLAEGMSNKQIAHQLNIAEKTVKVHVSAILERLEVANRTQAALCLPEVKRKQWLETLDIAVPPKE